MMTNASNTHTASTWKEKANSILEKALPDGYISLLKLAAALALIIFLLVQLTAGKISASSWESVQAAVNNAAGIKTDEVPDTTDQPERTQGDAKMFRRLYGLDAADFAAVELYYPAGALGADELVLIKLKTPDQAAEVENAMNARKTSQMNNFEGYAPESYEIISNAVIDVREGYALFVAGSDAESVRKAFRRAL
jgi:hypothetical protein